MSFRHNSPGNVVALAAVLSLVISVAVRASAADSIDDLTGPWRLLVDDHHVAVKSNVVRTYHVFQKHAGNPVLSPDKPWEGTIVYIYGTVLPNETRTGFRMWYHTARTNNPDDGDVQLYATSTNGIHWTKPNLGLRSYFGSTNNNMYLNRTVKSGIMSVMQTPDDPDPAQRYKFMSKNNPGYWAAWSSNGINTVDPPNNPVFTGGSDVGQFIWDPHTQIYRGYVKNGWTDANGRQRRAVALTTTTNITSWPQESLILWPDNYDDRWIIPGSVQRTHFYGLSAFPYESGYVGFLWIFRGVELDGDNPGYLLGPVFAEVVSSHDGVNWIREEVGNRPAILPLGPNGSWDDGQLYTARAPVLDGDTLKLWYGGCDMEHGAPTRRITCHIGLATLRKDGFGSLDAGATNGVILTKALSGAGGPLQVNCQVNGGGSVRVEVLDQNNNVLPGYSQADCVPLTGNSVTQTVAWASHSTLPAGQPLMRLRFIFQNASLYSFMPGGGVSIVELPTITQQPVDAFVSPGSAASFTLQAIGPGPLSYQWQKNGANLNNGGHYSGATSNVLTITGADANDAAGYRCVITNIHGSVTSSVATLTLVTEPPPDPIANAATAITDNGFMANWSTATGAAGYRLDASTNNNFTDFLAGYQDLNVGNVLNWPVSGLSPGTTCYYRVRAYNGAGTSTNSNTITVTTTVSPPPAPVATTATGITQTGFNANWNVATGATGYRLDVATNNAFSSFVTGHQDLDVGNALTRSVTGLSANRTYFYRVRAYNGIGTSTNSGTISATTAAAQCVGIVNPSFEGGHTLGVADGWTAYQRPPNPSSLWTIQTVSPPSGGGLQYQQIANTGSTGGAGVRQDITGCVPGGTYTISGWMRGNSSSDATCTVKVSPSASTDWATATNLNPPQTYIGSTWVAFSGAVVATGTSMTLWLDGRTAGTGGYKAECFDAINVACTSIPTPLQFSSVKWLASNQVQLVLSGQAGSNVTILRSGNLTNWITLTNLANPTGTLQITDSTAADDPQRFYRATSP